MARRRHMPEQIIRKLREADRLPAGGAEAAEVAWASGRTSPNTSSASSPSNAVATS